jgi:hypothetical protein
VGGGGRVGRDGGDGLKGRQMAKKATKKKVKSETMWMAWQKGSKANAIPWIWGFSRATVQNKIDGSGETNLVPRLTTLTCGTPTPARKASKKARK